MLFSISQALLSGHHVHFGNSPGLLLKDTKAFIPFVRDTHTGMYLLPLVPPVSRHNGTYPLQQAMRAAVLAISISNPSRILPAIPITKYTPSDITLHNTLGHIAHRRTQQLDVGIPQPFGKKITCPEALLTAFPLDHKRMQTDLLARELARMMRWDGDNMRAINLHFSSITELHHTMGFICDLSMEDVLKSVLLATLRASPNSSLRAAYHTVLDTLDDGDKELTFALIQDHCAREIRRSTREPDRCGQSPWR